MNFDILDLIFPPRCVYCATYLSGKETICAICLRRIVPHRGIFCGKCRAHLHSPRHLCHRDFPYLLAAAGEYADPALQALIRSLKFGFARDAAIPLSLLLDRCLRRARLISHYDLLLPIPLGQKRVRERGFNQSWLIARELARKIGIRAEGQVLQRIRNTAPQSSLSGEKQRRINIAGCFAIPQTDLVRGRNIILVDDVITSGATALEASLVLRAAGAREILVLVTAKAR